MHFLPRWTLTQHAFLNHLQESDLAIATKKTRMTTVNNLFAVAVRVGLLDRILYPSEDKDLKGTRNTGYRPFNKRSRLKSSAN